VVAAAAALIATALVREIPLRSTTTTEIERRSAGDRDAGQLVEAAVTID